MSRPDRGFRLLQAISFTSSFDRMLIAPLLVGIADDLGISLASATLIATVHFFAYGTMQIVWAGISDRYGRIFALRLSLTLAAVAGVLAFLSPTFTMLLLARTLAGASYAAGIPGALTYIGDTLAPELRHGPMTDLMRGTAMGVVAGLAGGGVLIQFMSWRIAFLSVGFCALILAVLVKRLPEAPAAPRARPVASLAIVLRNRWALLVMFLGAAEGCVLLTALNFLPAALEDQNGTDAATAGLVVAAYGVTILFATPVVKAIALRCRPETVTGLGGLSAVASLATFAYSLSLSGVLIGCALLGLAWAMLHTSLQTWATEVSPQARAIAVSLFATCLFTGSALGTALGGWLLAVADYSGLFTVFLAMAVPVMLAAWIGRGRFSLKSE